MTKTKLTKRALLASTIAVFVSVAMLLGTTFAWFTDSVTSSGNIIKTGDLDVTLEYSDDILNAEDNGWINAAEGAIFNYDNWEPGYATVKYVKIENEGSLDLKFILNIIPDVEAGSVNLADVIEVYMVSGAVSVARTDLNTESTAYRGTLSSLIAENDGAAHGKLYAAANADPANGKNQVEVYTLVLKMSESAGNEYQGQSVGGSFTVQLLATQLASEFDDIDDQYDADAEYPVTSQTVTIDGEAEGDTIFRTPYMTVTTTADFMNSLDGIADSLQLVHSDPRVDTGAVIFDSVEFLDANGDVVDLETLGNEIHVNARLYVGDSFASGTLVRAYHDGKSVAEIEVDADGYITYDFVHFCEVMIADAPAVTIDRNGEEYAFLSIYEAMENIVDGDVVTLRKNTNTSNSPLTETIVVDKDIIFKANGMYLVSAAPATFTVVEGGKLCVEGDSYTIRNSYNQGAAVLLDGGEFEMRGGSFDAYAAVRTTAGKSSVAALSAGWSNRVTVGFDLKGDDTVNVTGGSLYTSKEAIKSSADTYVEINISGGLLSSGAGNTSAAILLNGTATVNMTGGTVNATYQSGLNGSSAIEANVAPTTINISGNASLSGRGWGIVLGSHWSSPAVFEERFTLNVSGDAQVSAPGETGFGIRYCQDNCDVTIAGNAKISGTFHAIQMNSNSYVFTNSTLTIAENAKITSNAGRYGGGYAVAAYGNVTITGGTISGSTVGLAAYGAGVTVVVDNSVSGTPITINKADIGADVNYTVAGDPSIG